MSTIVSRPPAASKGSLFDWKLLLGALGVLALLAASLLTGVYDVFGAEDGDEMFAITRIPRSRAVRRKTPRSPSVPSRGSTP